MSALCESISVADALLLTGLSPDVFRSLVAAGEIPEPIDGHVALVPLVRAVVAVRGAKRRAVLAAAAPSSSARRPTFAELRRLRQRNFVTDF